jgi:hypothetical protein
VVDLGVLVSGRQRSVRLRGGAFHPEVLVIR